MIIAIGTWIGLVDGRPMLEVHTQAGAKITFKLTSEAAESLIVGASAPLLPRVKEESEEAAG